MQLTKNFTLKEFVHSTTALKQGIDNTPPKSAMDNLTALAVEVLQPLRNTLGKALIINSGYRSPELNKAVGGVPTSQHLKGQAADIRSNYFKPIEIARTIKDLRLPFDQVIVYPTFVHVSHNAGGRQRGNILYNKSYKGEKL